MEIYRLVDLVNKNNKKVALICGVSGQDGAYLGKFLFDKGYDVWGTSRDADGASFSRLKTVGVHDCINTVSMVPENFSSVLSVINKIMPSEIYFLAGQSSVSLSFTQPAETIKSSVIGILNLLEACRLCEFSVKLYNAGSSECFGEAAGNGSDINTPFNPRSPYAVAKSSAFWLVNNYREAYNIYACTGILFNHDSPLRQERFVTQKIIQAVKRIASGSNEKLELGRTDITRDWGWAPDYVEAMWKMLQQDCPEDFVIATGQSYTLQQFIEEAFSVMGLDWKEHVVSVSKYLRPTDILVSRANVSRANEKLGWKAKHVMPDVVRKMILDKV